MAVRPCWSCFSGDRLYYFTWGEISFVTIMTASRVPMYGEREKRKEKKKVGGVSGNYWRRHCSRLWKSTSPTRLPGKKSSTPWISLELCRLIRKQDGKCCRVKKQGTDKLKAEMKELMREVQKKLCQSSWNCPHLNFWEDTLSCRLLPQLILPKNSEGLDFRVQASSRGGWWWAGLSQRSSTFLSGFRRDQEEGGGAGPSS